MDLTVSRNVNGGRQLLNFDLKPALDILQHFNVFLLTDEGDGESLCSESTSTSHLQLFNRLVTLWR